MRSNFIRIIGVVAVMVMALGNSRPVFAADAERAATSPAPDKPVATQFGGTIIAVDTDTARLTVKGTAVSETFTVAPDATIVTKEKAQGKLADLKNGDKVDVVYRVDDSGLIATRIEVLSP